MIESNCIYVYNELEEGLYSSGLKYRNWKSQLNCEFLVEKQRIGNDKV